MTKLKHTQEQIAAVAQRNINHAMHPDVYQYPARLQSQSSERKRARRKMAARYIKPATAQTSMLSSHHAAVAEIASIARVRREVARVRSVAKLHVEGAAHPRLVAPMLKHGSFDAWCSDLIGMAKVRLKSMRSYTKLSAGVLPA